MSELFQFVLQERGRRNAKGRAEVPGLKIEKDERNLVMTWQQKKLITLADAVILKKDTLLGIFEQMRRLSSTSLRMRINICVVAPHSAQVCQEEKSHIGLSLT